MTPQEMEKFLAEKMEICKAHLCEYVSGIGAEYADMFVRLCAELQMDTDDYLTAYQTMFDKMASFVEEYFIENRIHADMQEVLRQPMTLAMFEAFATNFDAITQKRAAVIH